MMRLILLAVTAFLAFAIAAIALAPARLAHDALLAPHGISAASVSGTVWNARWQGLTYGRMRVREAQARLSALSVLGGAPAFAFTLADGRNRADGLAILAGDSVEIRDVSARLVPASAVLAAGPLAHVLDEPLIISQVQGRFGPRGCEALAGSVRFAGLTALDAQGAGRFPAMDGVLECAAGLPAIRLQGETGDVRAEAFMRFDTAGGTWSLTATPHTQAMALALRAAGLEGSGSDLRAEGTASW